MAALEAPGEPGAIRRAEARLGRPAQDIDVAEAVGNLLGQIGGAIGAAIVDHEHERIGNRLPDAGEDISDVLGFLVGRDDDEGRTRGRHSMGRSERDWTRRARWGA